jgi:hypothetical protein
MPPSDFDLAKLCQSQSLNENIFDHDFVVSGDRYSIKYYPDCTVVVHEGSHDFLNWFYNADFVMIKIPDFAGVDMGFDLNVSVMTQQAIPLIPKDKPVYFTGHSRGAPRAQLMAARFIKQGYQVVVVVFASPRPGDAMLARILNEMPIRSYRNYGNFDEQDFVCDVPLPYPFGYVHPVDQIIIDVPPEPNDAWGIFARHHLQLYIEGLQNGQSNASPK